jgi:broad specificity phosphatase PhoE
MTRTYELVRHAQAVYQRLTFRAAAFPRGTDWPLSELGEQQAMLLGPILAARGNERIVSSTLARAKQTARLAASASGLPYEDAWPELNEISPRRLRRVEARRRPQWIDGLVGAWHMRQHMRGVPSRTRDLESLEVRIREVLARLDTLPERRIAVISHGYFIMMLALVVPGRVRARPIRNCSITRVESDGRGNYELATFASRVIA